MHPSPATIAELMACPDCDLLMPKHAVPDDHSLHCPRCGRIIEKKISNSIDKVLALSLAGLLLYLPAITLPLMTFNSLGFSDSANILESIVNFQQNGYLFVALMTLLSAVVLPLLLLSMVAVISFKLRRSQYPRYLSRLYRTYLHLEEWAMVEVYLLGIMITIIKMLDSTEIQYHGGLFSFVLLVIITLAISTVLDKQLFWQLIGNEEPQRKTSKSPLPLALTTSAMKSGLCLCHTCHKLAPIQDGEQCIRCGATLHSRKSKSRSRTWALVITSTIFLAPANFLPIMRVDFLGIADNSTILDGIIYFFHEGAYFIGLIIFTASILVPLFKIVGLMILLLSTSPCSKTHLRQKTQMYRFIAFIGRWSMLDVFVIALLTVLVDFGFFTSIHTAPAATYFCMVVASTMCAAITFDPRLIWDNCFPCSPYEPTTFDNTPKLS